VASTIKEARQQLGVTQKQMADLLGMTQPMVGKIEGGVEGRKETKGHIAHLIALELIFDHGLLEDLISNLNE